MTSIAPRPAASDDGRRAPTLCIDARVTHYAAPLLEFILSEADIGWREIARGDVDARVVIETTADRLDVDGWQLAVLHTEHHRADRVRVTAPAAESVEETR